MFHQDGQDLTFHYNRISRCFTPEYSAINATLKRSTDIANKLELRYGTLVFNEAVYSKLQHVS